MRGAAIARNYAQTLLELAQRHGGDATVDEYGAALDELTDLLETEPRIREFLQTPLVNAAAKQDALRKTLQGRVPDLFLRFLLVTIEKRRAAYLQEIAAQYHEQVDELRGRVRAEVTLAREPDEALRREIRNSLERMLGREVIASYSVDRDLIGGVVIRAAGRILDGSVRRRASDLRRRLLATKISGLALR